MTSQKDNMSIAEHGIITQEALMAYLNNELTEEQKQQLEQLLKNDPFSQDALEGLRSAHDKEAVSSSLVTIRKKVNERIGKREKRMIPFHWSNYAYAAVILGLLISVAFILTTYFNKHREDIAMNKAGEQTVITPQQEIKQAPPAAPATAPDTVAATPSPSTGMAATTVTNEEKNKQPVSEKEKNTAALTAKPKTTDTTKTNSTYTLMAQKSANQTNNNAVVNPAVPAPAVGSVSNNSITQTLEEEQTISNTNKQTDNKSVANDQDNLYAPSTPGTSAPANNRKEQLRQKAVASQNQSANYLVAPTAASAMPKPAAAPSSEDDARKSFFSGDYKKSEVQYDSVLQRQPENSDALFFGGISDYVNGDLDKAGKNFDKLLQKNKRYVDGSKWYKANILLKKGQKDAGINLLQELAHSGGSYKERAQKKLAELQQ